MVAGSHDACLAVILPFESLTGYRSVYELISGCALSPDNPLDCSSLASPWSYCCCYCLGARGRFGYLHL